MDFILSTQVLPGHNLHVDELQNIQYKTEKIKTYNFADNCIAFVVNLSVPLSLFWMMFQSSWHWLTILNLDVIVHLMQFPAVTGRKKSRRISG